MSGRMSLSIIDGIRFMAVARAATTARGVSRKWGYHAAFINGGVEVETGSNKLPNPEPNAPL